MLSRNRLGRGLLTVTSVLAIAACDAASGVAGPEGQPGEQELVHAHLVVVGGNDQEAPVGTTAPDPLVVRVMSEDGSPIANAPVEWTFVQGRGRVSEWDSPLEVVLSATDAEGMSTVEWQLGVQAGVQVASAAIVVSGGVLSGTAAGPTTAPPSDRGKKVGFQVKAKPGSVHEISLTPDAVTAEPGDSVRLDAVVADQFGNEIEEASLNWSSSNGSVAQVDADGVVRMFDAGTARITANSGPVEGVAELAVVDNSLVPASVVVRPQDVRLQLGDTLRLDATILDSEGLVLSGSEVAWNSSDSTVLSVDSGGLVTALGVGNAIVRATVDGVSGEQNAVVEEPVADRPKTVDDLAVVAASDSSLTLRWTGVDDGTGSPASYAIRTGSPSISWGAAYETERTVSGNDVGVMQELEWTGLESSITHEFQVVAYRGTLNDSAVFGSVSAVVSGTTDGAPEPEGLTVVAAPAQIQLAAVGDTATLSVHAENGVGEVVEDVTFQFSSSDPTTVEVDTMGRLTARSLGAAVITVTTLCCDSAELVGVQVGDGGDVFFEDNFDNGQKNEANGFEWGGAAGSVAVSSENSYSGDYSLQFAFGPDQDGEDSWEEQRFSFPDAGQVWVQYRVYVPENFYHRSQAPDNNKFLQLNQSGGNNMLTVEYAREGSASSLRRFLSESEALNGSDNWPVAFAGKSNFIGPDASYALQAGRWTLVGVHYKAGSDGILHDGRAEIWVDGVLFNALDWPLWEPSRLGQIDGGYIFGWSNSGFAEETKFYIDDFKIWLSDPGWGS